jgi:16S rRNA (guanine527-N7)-methyltransferase
MAVPRFSAAEVRARLTGTSCAAAEVHAEPLAEFLSLLAKWNRVYNLTGFRRARALLDRVLLECLTLSPWLEGREIADVGSGAGLPGLPLAITRPQLQFTLIESRAKRVRFLRHVVGELALTNVAIEHCRAEDLPADLSFDTVLARAVAAPQEFIKIARHLTRPGSLVVLPTSAQKGEAYRHVPDDFDLSQIAPAGADGEFGVVVLLRRVA